MFHVEQAGPRRYLPSARTKRPALAFNFWRGRASSSATTISFGGTWTGVTKFVRIA
jgi:hypothetical protein